MSKIKSIMFFCKNNEGTGHLHRILALCRGLKKLDSYLNLTIIFEGKYYSQFKKVKRINILSIDPNLDKISKNKIFEEQIFLHKPEIMVIEAFPFDKYGVKDEIIYLLNIIKLNFPLTKIISSIGAYLGNIHPYPKKEFMEKINYYLNKYFDLILAHTDPKVSKVEEEFELNDTNSNKVIYTGYVTYKSKSELIPKEKVIKEIEKYNKYTKKTIIVHVGGGDKSLDLLYIIIEISSSLDNYLFLISTGPTINEENYTILMEKSKNKKNIFITKYNPNLVDYLAVADLSINMAGYNSMMDILVSGVSSISVPKYNIKNKEFIVDQEQLLRCKKLKKLGFIDFVEPSEISLDNLKKKIIENTNIKRKIKNINLEGRDKTASIILSLLE